MFRTAKLISKNLIHVLLALLVEIINTKTRCNCFDFFYLLGGMENIKQHTFALAHYTYTVLSTLKHANGAPLVHIYCDTDFNNPDIQGPIINFNVLDENGEIVGYSQVHFNKSPFS